MNITPDSILAVAIEFDVMPRGTSRFPSKDDARSLEAFANHFYMIGADAGSRPWRDVFGHLGENADMAGNAIHFNNDQYESRIATQKTITANLQAQIERQATDLAKARMLLRTFTDIIPGMQFPKEKLPDVNRVRELTASFLKETK